MGRYLSIQLKEEFCSQAALDEINADLRDNYLCPNMSGLDDFYFVFNTPESVALDIDFFNRDPNGKKTNLSPPTPDHGEGFTGEFSALVRLRFSGNQNQLVREGFSRDCRLAGNLGAKQSGQNQS